MISYAFHKDSVSGSTVVFNFPTYDNTVGNPAMPWTTGTPTDLETLYPDIFSTLYTFIGYPSADVFQYGRIGFTEIITPTTADQFYYLDENNYIKIKLWSGFARAYFYDAQGEIFSVGGLSDRLVSFPTINNNLVLIRNPCMNIFSPNFQYDTVQAGTLSGPNAYGDDIKARYLAFFGSVPPYTPDTDPYTPDGTSETGGGGGTPDPSEDITDPSLPTVSAVDTGFITLFKPSVSNLNSLATYLWSGGFDIDTFKKVMANPMDAILGLSILPGIVPSGGSSTVVIGNISTGVSMPKVGNQYVKFNCGSKTIKRKWNAFLDYSPYTRAYIYLPYIGIHPLEVDDIMNKSVTVKYNIDVLSGGCTAFVIAGGTTLYSFTGQCACSVPVTGRDWTSLINGVLGAVTGTVGAIGSAMVGNLPGAIAGAASVAQNVLSSKPTIERSGSMGGMAGMMGIRTPYIIIERPVQAVPGKQNKYIGYPSFVTKKLGDVSGYTQAEITHLEAIPATLTEQEEIKNLLEEGVIL